MVDVVLDSRLRDVKFPGDFLVRKALTDTAEDLAFPVREGFGLGRIAIPSVRTTRYLEEQLRHNSRRTDEFLARHALNRFGEFLDRRVGGDITCGACICAFQDVGYDFINGECQYLRRDRFPSKILNQIEAFPRGHVDDDDVRMEFAHALPSIGAGGARTHHKERRPARQVSGEPLPVQSHIRYDEHARSVHNNRSSLTFMRCHQLDGASRLAPFS